MNSKPVVRWVLVLTAFQNLNAMFHHYIIAVGGSLAGLMEQWSRGWSREVHWSTTNLFQGRKEGSNTTDVCYLEVWYFKAFYDVGPRSRKDGLTLHTSVQPLRSLGKGLLRLSPLMEARWVITRERAFSVVVPPSQRGPPGSVIGCL